MIDYSVILPCYNESESLPELTERLSKVLATLSSRYELIFVDDGSTDDTHVVLRQLKSAYPDHLRVLRLSRNFGHHFAITAGLDHCRGENVIVMDSDLQMLPEEIPTLLNKLKEGYDMVYAVWEKRNDRLTKRLLSWFFRWVINTMTRLPVPINSSIFRAMNRKCVDALIQLREQSRFITGLGSWIGFHQAEVRVPLGARKYGAPKYSFLKSLELAMRTIAAFTHFPLQLLFYLSFLMFFISAAFTLVILGGILVVEHAVLLNLMMYFQAVNFFIFGLLGEYIGRILYETQRRPLYVVAEEF